MGEASHSTADMAETDNAHCLTAELCERFVPATEVLAAGPHTCTVGCGIFSHMTGGFKQEGHCQLGNAFGTVSGSVADCDAVRTGCADVDHVVSAGSHTD